jgi:hypothetical protein
VLTSLGLVQGSGGELVMFDDPRAAVEGADFVQESVPERVALKHELYAAVEPVLGADAVVASSASGPTLGELQEGWRDPSRLVLGHPFNPPHLIPVVEVMGNQRTAPGVVDRARGFYESVGKVTIEVRRPTVSSTDWPPVGGQRASRSSRPGATSCWQPRSRPRTAAAPVTRAGPCCPRWVSTAA